MPTASKLISAVVFALVAFLAVHVFIPVLPEGTQTKGYREVAAAIGFFSGWLIMGPSTGRGYAEAVNRGLVTSVSILFWSLLALAIYLMVRKSTRMMYDGPMEAVLGIFEIMLEFGALLKHPATPAVLVVGGVVGGWIAETAGRRWS